MRWRVANERRKYGNKPVDGFPSKKEAARYRELQLLQLGGIIANLQRQVPFLLGGGISYIPDFTYEEHGRKVAEDAKGFATPVFKVKAAWFRQKYPDWELRIT